jgi:DNA (cytosine-5)-methyltransferase 1
MTTRTGTGTGTGRDGMDDYCVPTAFGWQNSAHQGDSVSTDHTPTLDKSKVPAIAYPIEQGNQGGGGNLGFGNAGDPCFTLNASHPHATATATAVRRLTPRECARLQGFPDDYLDIEFRGKPATDSPKYRALGNSMAVPVMAWIGQRIAKVDGNG